MLKDVLVFSLLTLGFAQRPASSQQPNRENSFGGSSLNGGKGPAPPSGGGSPPNGGKGPAQGQGFQPFPGGMMPWMTRSNRTNITGISCGRTVGIVEEETEGPYWVDVNLNRTEITQSRPGVPLTLVLHVFNTSQCNNASSSFGVVPRAQVDIWHCDAQGIYSDIASEGTLNQTWLRGYQVTDATGAVTFRTIFPGWYSGRTIHIHIRLRVFHPTTNALIYNDTTQLFFQPELINQVLSVAPYNSHGKLDTTNANDMIYSPYTLLNTTGGVTQGLNAEGSLYFPFVSNPDAFMFGGMGSMPPGGGPGGPGGGPGGFPGFPGQGKGPLPGNNFASSPPRQQGGGGQSQSFGPQGVVSPQSFGQGKQQEQSASRGKASAGRR